MTEESNQIGTVTEYNFCVSRHEFRDEYLWESVSVEEYSRLRLGDSAVDHILAAKGGLLIIDPPGADPRQHRVEIWVSAPNQYQLALFQLKFGYLDK